jgi:hypothetical protein
VEIDRFLKAGPTPIYVGFGSIVVDNPIKLTNIVFKAIQKTGQRALVSKGWGGLGADEVDVPDNILIIGNCPHDWLFRQVSCVIHHGGAGTTAAGLAHGRPTIIVPFFGDQQFWGDIVARAGAGPVPIPYKRLNVQNLSDAIEKALEASTLKRAQAIAMDMQEEAGVQHGVCSFYRHLDVQSLRCSIFPNRPAAWHLKHTKINLSAYAATVLVKSGKLSPDMLVLSVYSNIVTKMGRSANFTSRHRSKEYDTFRDPAGPLTASAQLLVGSIPSFMTGLVDAPRMILLDFVSAVREVGHPHEHLNRHEACRAAVLSPDHSSREDSEESGQGQVEDEEDDEQVPNEESTQRNSADEDNETYFNGSIRSSSIERKRSLQQEQAKPMSSSMSPSKSQKVNILYEASYHASKLSKNFLRLIILLPTDVSLSMARGFHNAPKLYHDPTVKDTPQVISIRSGFRASLKVVSVPAPAWGQVF